MLYAWSKKSVEPRCFKQAVLDEILRIPMDMEMKALNRNHTLELVDLPKDRKPIGCKWVYKIKHKETGEINRYKARLVAKGFSQREGIAF